MPEHFRDIDHYLATFPPDVQAVLQQIRLEIHRAVPGSSEVISYNIPTMTRGGQRYVHFAGWKAHVSLYPTPDADEDLARPDPGVGDVCEGEGVGGAVLAVGDGSHARANTQVTGTHSASGRHTPP